MRRLIVAGLVAVFLPTGASAWTKATQYLVNEQIATGCDGPGTFDPATVFERDLTGDGKADLLLSHEGLTCKNTPTGRSNSCGMLACDILIYVRQGTLLVPVVTSLNGYDVTISADPVPIIRMRGFEGQPGSMRWDGSAFD